MASLGRFLPPIRVSFSSLSSLPNPTIPSSKNPLIEKYILLKKWVRALDPAVQVHTSKCQLNLNMRTKWIHNLSYAGRKIDIRSFLGLPFFIGAMQFRQTVAYAFDGEANINKFSIPIASRNSPFQMYVFDKELEVRCKAMRQNPVINKLRAPYARKVEVQDYKLLCLARVELRDKRITLMGILGSWWILQSSELESSLPFYSKISGTDKK